MPKKKISEMTPEQADKQREWVRQCHKRYMKLCFVTRPEMEVIKSHASKCGMTIKSYVMEALREYAENHNLQ